MSAIISVATADQAFLLTDGAGYDDEGIVQTIRQKVATAAVPFAVSTRGPAHIGGIVAQKLCAGADEHGVDRFLDMLPHILAGMRDDPEVAALMAGDDLVEVVIAGWSRTIGAFHRVFATDNRGDRLPFELVEPDGAHVAAPIESEFQLPDSMAHKQDEPAADFMRRIGADVLEMLRSHRGLRVDGSMSEWFAVGGHCDLTIVGSEGVTVERLRTWPDRIGERIVPGDAPGVGLAAWAAPRCE